MKNLNRPGQNKRGRLSKKGGSANHPYVLESMKAIAVAVSDLLRSPGLRQLFKVVGTFVVISMYTHGGVGAHFEQQLLRLVKML